MPLTPTVNGDTESKKPQQKLVFDVRVSHPSVEDSSRKPHAGPGINDYDKPSQNNRNRKRTIVGSTQRVKSSLKDRIGTNYLTASRQSHRQGGVINQDILGVDSTKKKSISPQKRATTARPQNAKGAEMISSNNNIANQEKMKQID